MKKSVRLAMLALATAFATPAFATVVTLTFEGVGDVNEVNDFYNGGAGTNYGVQFQPETIAVVAVGAGGSGSVANAPTPDTVLFFRDQDNANVNFAGGFTGGFSFWYSSLAAADVTVWDGLDGTGNLLATIGMAAQSNTQCPGSPSVMLCEWTNADAAFAGTAKSVNFGGAANMAFFDDLTFGKPDVAFGEEVQLPANGAVPEPATWAMMIGGFGAIGGSLRYRRRKTNVSFA